LQSQQKTFPTANKDYSYKKTHTADFQMGRRIFWPSHRREKHNVLKAT